jgi:hypothetical protein
MKKTATNNRLLQLLVRVVNQSIQSYYYFPDVIICGDHRLEREEFELLLKEGCLESYHADSFGKIYHTSKKAEHLLHENLCRRRHRTMSTTNSVVQAALPF